MALIVLIYKISKGLENGDCIIRKYSWFFDTADHTILLQNVYIYRLQDVTL